MSKSTLQVAIDHGEALPTFPDPETARLELYRQRDQSLALLAEASHRSVDFEPDYHPESLKSLEKWYFLLWDAQSFCTAGMGRREFEIAMAMYFGEVMVRNASGFEWTVEEYAFELGRYEIGVRREPVYIMLSRYTDLFARIGNKKKQSIWQEYRKYSKQP